LSRAGRDGDRWVTIVCAVVLSVLCSAFLAGRISRAPGGPHESNPAEAAAKPQRGRGGRAFDRCVALVTALAAVLSVVMARSGDPVPYVAAQGGQHSPAVAGISPAKVTAQGGQQSATATEMACQERMFIDAAALTLTLAPPPPSCTSLSPPSLETAGPATAMKAGG
jgi:hypothetical protein